MHQSDDDDPTFFSPGSVILPYFSFPIFLNGDYSPYLAYGVPGIETPMVMHLGRLLYFFVSPESPFLLYPAVVNFFVLFFWFESS